MAASARLEVMDRWLVTLIPAGHLIPVLWVCGTFEPGHCLFPRAQTGLDTVGPHSVGPATMPSQGISSHCDL